MWMGNIGLDDTYILQWLSLSSSVVKWRTTAASCLGDSSCPAAVGHLVTITPWQTQLFSSNRRAGKAFFSAFPFSDFLSIKWWAAGCCQAEGACICTHRGSPAVSFSQCHVVPELHLCCSTQNQAWASGISNVAVFILKDLSCYAAAISVSTVLDIWVLWQIKGYLHAVFVWQCEHRYPFSLGVLLCSHATDTHECFLLAFLCSVFCSVLFSFWKWLNPLYINISFMFLT